MITRILNIILALLIFISSSGFILNKHYCQNELKNTALFVQPLSCHDIAKMPASCPMHQRLKACGNHEGEEKDDKNCCSTESEYIALDQDQQLQNFEFQHLNYPALLATIFLVFNIDLPTTDNANLHYLNYKPPLIVCDFPPVLQTFLL